MDGHRDLKAWQMSKALVLDIYRASKNFPREEVYGLTSQRRRAAVSVPSNIAEGQGRSSKREFHCFVGHARGSLLEVETQLEIARDLGYLEPQDASALLAKTKEIGRVLNGLRTWCETK
jgi:four helix bundle protein